LKFISWNVNGVRAVWKKGFPDWFKAAAADVVCLQETKAQPDQLTEDILKPLGWHGEWHWGEKKGYSGVATFSKVPPQKVERGFNLPAFDNEGRVLATQHGDVTLFNIYFPNGKRDDIRLKFKMDFYAAFLDEVIPRYQNRCLPNFLKDGQ
jgi:exodeoxyribonuclease-3